MVSWWCGAERSRFWSPVTICTHILTTNLAVCFYNVTSAFKTHVGPYITPVCTHVRHTSISCHEQTIHVIITVARILKIMIVERMIRWPTDHKTAQRCIKKPHYHAWHNSGLLPPPPLPLSMRERVRVGLSEGTDHFWMTHAILTDDVKMFAWACKRSRNNKNHVSPSRTYTWRTNRTHIRTLKMWHRKGKREREKANGQIRRGNNSHAENAIKRKWRIKSRNKTR